MQQVPSSHLHISKSANLKLVLIAILIQVSVFSLNTYQEKKYKPEQYDHTVFAITCGDTPSYTEPIDNLLATGTYKSDSEEAGYSLNGRTPYYGIFYGFFRLFAEPHVAQDCLVILQLIIKIFSNTALFYLVLLLTGSRPVAWIAFLCYCCLAWASVYTPRVLTESLSQSFLIFGLYSFFLWLKLHRKRHFIFAALLLSYVICMRPFLLPAIGLFVLVNIYFNPATKPLVGKLKQAVLFFIPLVLFIAPWTVRNYVVSKKLIVFQESVNAGYHYTSSDISLRYFLTAVGENFIAWDYSAAGCWFDPNLEKFSTYEIPNSILCESVTKEKLELAKYHYGTKTLTGSVEDDRIADSLFVAMRNGFMEEKPAYYYVISPVKIAVDAFCHDGVELLQRKQWYELVYKIGQSGLFILISLGFVCCMVFRKFRNGGYLWIIPVMLAVVLCFGFRFCEKRYFIYAYPIFIIYAAVFFEFILRRIKVLKQ